MYEGREGGWEGVEALRDPEGKKREANSGEARLLYS